MNQDNLYQDFKVKRKGISSMVVDYIKQLIHAEKLLSGEKLPAERQMAEQLQVSRNSVREAYKILEVLGYVTIKHGDGVYVVDKEESYSHITTSFFLDKDDVEDLFAIRRIIELHAIEWAVDHLNKDNIEELAILVEDSLGLIKENANVEQLSHFDQKFHLAIAKLSGNVFLPRIMLTLFDLLEEVRIQSMRIAGRVSQSVTEHKGIVEALKTGDKQLVREKMAYHLDSVEKSLLRSLVNEKK